MRVQPLPIALLGALMLGTLAAAHAQPAASPKRIVILPIIVHSAAANASYVSGGISDMISSRLEQTGKLQVDRVEDPAAATTSLGKALRLGQSRGGDYLIFGAFTQFGDGASLDVHCIPLGVKTEAEAAAARRIFIQSGTMGEIIPKLDEIVDRVAMYVKTGGATPGPGQTPEPVAAAERSAADAETLRALTRRLEALEKAVFNRDENTAAQAAKPAPES